MNLTIVLVVTDYETGAALPDFLKWKLFSEKKAGFFRRKRDKVKKSINVSHLIKHY